MRHSVLTLAGGLIAAYICHIRAKRHTMTNIPVGEATESDLAAWNDANAPQEGLRQLATVRQIYVRGVAFMLAAASFIGLLVCAYLSNDLAAEPELTSEAAALTLFAVFMLGIFGASIWAWMHPEQFADDEEIDDEYPEASRAFPAEG